MIYVGRKLRPLGSWGEADPALINPKLRAPHLPSRPAGQMSYWPSYSQITPEARANYLGWLAGGRRGPIDNVGYVFLFFYGLERRAFFDALSGDPAARSDLHVLVREVRELRDTYGDDASFGQYATEFLDAAEILGSTRSPLEFEPPEDYPDRAFSLRTRMALGALAKAARPIPAEWALVWLRTGTYEHLRTPALRCRDEFNELFCLRYRERYGDGLVARPAARRLSISYSFASSTSYTPADLGRQVDLPDPAAMGRAAQKLRKLANSVCDELARYSRYRATHAGTPGPKALALLPAELVESRIGPKTRAILTPIRKTLEQAEIALVETASIVEAFPSRQEGRLTKSEASKAAGLLARLGYGIEPDPRYGGMNFATSPRAAVFRLPAGDRAPTEDFKAAGVLLRLAVTVAAADGVVAADERNSLETLVGSARVPRRDRLRLRARLTWLIAEPPTLHGLKRRAESLPIEARREIGQALILIAGADGKVRPGELDMLSRLYPYLGLDPEAVYGDVHALAAGPPLTGPVPVLSADPTAGFEIPGPGAQAPPGPIVLDPAKIQKVRESSRHASKMLEGIFTGGVGEGNLEAEEEPSPDISRSKEDMDGFDGAHAAFVQALAVRKAWPREAFEALAKEYGLLAAGAAEVINEVAFEACGEPLLEGFDPVDLNPYALKEMLP